MRVCVRAPFYRHPHLLRFSFRPLNILFPSLSSLLFFFFFFFFLFLRVCVYTRAILCALYFSSYITITRGCTRHFLLSSPPNSVTLRLTFTSGDVSLHRIDIRLRIVSLSVSQSFMYIYIYISIHTYIIYIYVYVCITVSAVSPMYHTASSLDLPL